jgi:hypothetical protein
MPLQNLIARSLTVGSRANRAVNGLRPQSILYDVPSVVVEQNSLSVTQQVTIF